MTRTATEATSQPNRRKRSFRCLRCEARKFRTPRDLALHILSKHGHVQIPTSAYEDARSVTLNSPFITSGDVAELDQLLKAAERKYVETESAAVQKESQQQPARDTSARISVSTKSRKRAPNPKPNPLQPALAKRKWSWTTSSSASSKSADSSSKSRHLPREGLCRGKSDENKLVEGGEGGEDCAVEGESVGPCAKDVYISKCRSGRVPLIPIQAQQSPAMLNFANGLF